MCGGAGSVLPLVQGLVGTVQGLAEQQEQLCKTVEALQAAVDRQTHQAKQLAENLALAGELQR